MRYAPSFITQVKNHFRLSDVIGRRIDIRRHGREFQACCPFHNEKTPSFTINDEKNFYHCFGCSAHGDAIKFLMEFDRLSYREAIEALAAEAGLALPKPDPAQEVRYNRENALLQCLQAAADYFSRQLQSSLGHAARSYLHSRDISESIIEEFSIGYAPQQREGLKFALREKGFSESQMLDCGLLTKVDGKATYDRFRGRVMFPIRRIDGQIIAFGGRLLEKSEFAPKYLNSPDTMLFHKQQVLFNMDKVRNIAHEAPSIVVVEGYTDVISLYACGVPYAVAPLGTAFGETHLQQLWRYNAAPIMCFDGDKAGQKAMLRAVEIALPHARSDQLLRFCGLPRGEDPDSFVRSSGAQAFEALLDRALSISELLWNITIGNRNFATPEELAAAEGKLFKILSGIKDDMLRRRIESSYKNRLWHISKQSRHGTKSATVTPESVSLLMKKARNPVVMQLEQIFALVVRYPALLNLADVEYGLSEWDWSQTYCSVCISDIIIAAEQLSECRYVMAEFLSREFPVIDTHLQKHYTQGVIPANLYGMEEAEGLGQAQSLFGRLKRKIEQQAMAHELQLMTRPVPQENPDSDAQTQSNERLLELIKLQQKAHSALTPEHADDSYC